MQLLQRHSFLLFEVKKALCAVLLITADSTVCIAPPIIRWSLLEKDIWPQLAPGVSGQRHVSVDVWVRSSVKAFWAALWMYHRSAGHFPCESDVSTAFSDYSLDMLVCIDSNNHHHLTVVRHEKEVVRFRKMIVLRVKWKVHLSVWNILSLDYAVCMITY